MNRTIAVVGDVYRLLATGEETGGSYALIEATVFPGGGPPPHTHSREEEGFYILEGEVAFYVQGARKVGRPGDSFHLVRGTVHRFANESESAARMLIWAAPAGLEEMFLKVGKPVEDPSNPPPITPDEIDRLLEIAPQFGVEILK